MSSRPSIVGPDAGPNAPYPLHMEGNVISGFGRGSKELGIPTANLPVDAALTPWIADMPSGVYFGYASLALPSTHPDHPDATTSKDAPSSNEAALLASAPQSNPPFHIFPMVMSIGYNPFYKNTVRSAEVHVLHKFTADFYDVPMRLLILGFIREEKDYKSLDALIEDINFDCEVAKNSLAREGWVPSNGRVIGGANIDGKLDAQWLTRTA
ncbi:riboflavin kinase [Fusarium falciforme]|uniref:Riboflavin kinase n=1 Tax=Fusarium falciforme TaxID=195108 RepID=A0A9W8REY0_9HYPO|nr:riboflavin kinase [Fusarium falciforme]KAJ4194038.1 riboflavin kinase [Fusarium falciforme]KAJ4205572.1 riboflavin kinase [Fusarium falciforme]KAJ4247336.1 riboflavin kinase [Fusarium falciforme]